MKKLIAAVVGLSFSLPAQAFTRNEYFTIGAMATAVCLYREGKVTQSAAVDGLNEVLRDEGINWNAVNSPALLQETGKYSRELCPHAW